MEYKSLPQMLNEDLKKSFAQALNEGITIRSNNKLPTTPIWPAIYQKECITIGIGKPFVVKNPKSGDAQKAMMLCKSLGYNVKSVEDELTNLSDYVELNENDLVAFVIDNFDSNKTKVCLSIFEQDYLEAIEWPSL